MEDLNPSSIKKPDPVNRRPFLLSVLCLFGFVYFALLTVLFTLALLYSGWITEVANQYIPENKYTSFQVVLIFLVADLLHATAFTGTVMIWNLKKWGYLLLGLSCLIIAGYHLSQPQITLSSTSLYIAFIFLFGLFFRRLK